MQSIAALVEFAEWDPDDFFTQEKERVFIELRDGANYFGRDPWNHIVLKGDGIGQYAGIFFLKEGKVFLRPAVGQKIMNDNKLVEGLFIYSGESGILLECGLHKFRVATDRGRIGIEFT